MNTRSCLPFAFAALLVFLTAFSPAAQAAVSVQLVEAGPRITLLRITVGSPKLEDVDTPAGKFQRFSQREGGQGGAGIGGGSLGYPELPVIGFPLALPIDTKTLGVDVKPEGDPRSLQATIFPVQPGEISRKQDRELPKFQFDRDLYLKGARQPGEALERNSIFKGDANVATFKFSPFGYDPSKGLLTYYPSYLVTIFHDAGDCFVIDRLVDTKTLPAFDGIDQHFERLPLPALPFALNKAFAIKQFCPPVLIPNLNLFGARFLIVTHPNFLAAANTLRAHKVALGISTLVVNTQTISGGPAVATAVQIRNWIANYSATHLIKPKWVLFVGDAEYIPTHYDLNNADDSAKNSSDIWYGQFGAGPTDIPPFGIGRFPVDTLAQANTIVSKVMAFETSPPPNPLFGSDFYNRLTFASYFQGSDPTDDRWFAETTELVRDYTETLGYSPQRIYTASAAANPLFYRGGGAIPLDLRKPGFAWNGTTADVVNAVNNGTSLLYHRDHGWWDGWGDPAFDTGDLGAISVTNNRFPVVFSINCASGIFDNETVDLPANVVGGGYGPAPGTVYWAEAFLRKADGALAVIGDSRSSKTIDNNHLTLGLFDAIFPGFIPGYGGATPIQRLGDVLNHARAFIAAVDSGATPNLHPFDVGGVRPGVWGLRQELNLYNLLGDPTVKLRVSPPWVFTLVNITLLQERAVIKLPIPEPPCRSCPFPELITAVAIDPKSGRVLGRTLIDAKGDGQIDLGGFKGNFWVRVGSPDGLSVQAALDETDTDGDSVPDSRDNCINVANREQLDTDRDGYGNACDGDLNNDGIVNSIDLAQFKARFGTRGETAADINGDGVVNALDLAKFRALFATRPGPSAWHLPASEG